MSTQHNPTGDAQPATVFQIRVHIDRRYALEQTAEAQRYVDQGHQRGNVVLTVNHREQL